MRDVSNLPEESNAVPPGEAHTLLLPQLEWLCLEDEPESTGTWIDCLRRALLALRLVACFSAPGKPDLREPS